MCKETFMKLGEFRKLMAELPDDAEIVVRNIFDDDLSVGKVVESVGFINLNGKSVEWKDGCLSWGDNVHEHFFPAATEEKEIDISKPILVIEGGFYFSDLDIGIDNATIL